MLNYSKINIEINQELTLDEILKVANPNRFHFYDRINGDTATLAYFFFTLLKRSPLIENFLLYSKKELSDYIDNIQILKYDGKYIDYRYTITTKTLRIRLNTSAVEDLRRYYTHFLSESYREDQRWHKDFLERPLDLKNYRKTAPPIFNTENYMFVSFDPILAHIKEFQELPENVQQRIINCEFTKKYDLGNLENQGTLKKNIEDYLNAESENLTRALEDRILEDYENISRCQNQIDACLKRIKETRDKMMIAQNTLNLSLNIEKLPADIIRIMKKPNSSGTLRFFTNPLFVNFDLEKLNTATTKVKEAVKQGFRFCIGTHIIDVEPGFALRFTPKSEFKNHHIEDANCYGTFKNHILDAQKEANLEKLLFLAHKMLISATIGDVMGNRTLENALIVDKDGFIQNYNSNSTTFTATKTHYIEKIKEQEESRGYYESSKTIL